MSSADGYRISDRNTGARCQGTFSSRRRPFVSAEHTLVTIFAGANDVDTIIAALGGGGGGADQTAYINSQIDAFGQDFATLFGMVRDRAPSARIIVLNLPEHGGHAKSCRAHLFNIGAPSKCSRSASTRRVINPKVSSGVIVVDLMCDARSYPGSTYSSDGFHPSDIGYAWIAAEVIAAATTSYRAPASSCAQMTMVQ